MAFDPHDPAPPTTTYPVIDSAELEPVPARRFGRRRRQLHQIPRQPPGSVLVFQTGDAYDLPADGALRLDDDLVVDAAAVAVVSIKHEVRDIAIQVPTLDAGFAVAVRARYLCQVSDPLLVLEAGCWHIDPLLESHLQCRDRVGAIAMSTSPWANWPSIRSNTYAYVKAFHEVEPFVVPGVHTHLIEVVVEPVRLATVPKARANHEPDPASRPGGTTVRWPRGEDTERATDGPVTGDGHPAFVPGNYSWGDEA